MKRGSRFDFRRIYSYVCKVCKKKRGTRIYRRRIAKICMVCKKNKVNKNQMNLIDESGLPKDRKGTTLDIYHGAEIFGRR